MKKILLFLMVSIVAFHAIAQDTEFWFAPPSNYIGKTYDGYGGFVFTNPTPRPATVRIKLFNPQAVSANVDEETITVPAYGGYHRRYTNTEVKTYIAPSYKASINVGTPPAFLATSGTPGTLAGIPQQGGVLITSNEQIMVYYLYDDPYNRDIFTLKGKTAKGTDFYVPQSSDGYFLNGGTAATHIHENSRDMINIMATEPGNTTVSFTVPRPCWRAGEANTQYAANTLHQVTLNQGDVFMLMETVRGTTGSFNTLGGTHITASQNIVVTSMEDYTNYDAAGDQLVPVDRSGTLYTIVKGYSTGIEQDKVYMIATQPGTNITITPDGAAPTTMSLSAAGSMGVYNMGNSTAAPYEATIAADKPILTLHFTADGVHPASAIVPSIYSISQNQFSFFQMGGSIPNAVENGMMLVYRQDCDTSFMIDYAGIPGGQPLPLVDPQTGILNSVLSGVGFIMDTPDRSIPGLTGSVGWNYMRVTLPDASNNTVVTVTNNDSPFSLGYYSGSIAGGDPIFHSYNSYGYLSGFGDWEFDPDTIWRCSSNRLPVTLMGGYARSYKWTLPDGSIKTDPTIRVYDQGMYILEMDQDFRIITDTCWVVDMVFNAKIDRLPRKPAKVGVPQDINVTFNSVPNLTFEWSFEGGVPATSTSASPTVVWNSSGEKRVSVKLTAWAKIDQETITCDTTIVLDLMVRPKNNGYFVDQKVSGGLRDGSNWQNAFTTIQEALEMASQGDYVWVAEGEYAPPANGTFLIDYDSVQVYGGFGAWESSLNERDFGAHPTIMNGRNNSVVTFDGSTSYTNGFCGTGNAALIDGFIIQGGTADYGAGIYFTGGASGTVSNCVVRNNTARRQGGGIYMTAPGCGHSAPVFLNLEVSGNTAAQGAGIYNDGSDFIATNITVAGNYATTTGGLYNNGNADIRNSIIWGNRDNTEALNPTDITTAGGTPAYTYSIIAGSNGSGENWNTAIGIDAGKNLDVNPLFRMAGFDAQNNKRQGIYSPTAASKAVNSGRNYFALTDNRILRNINLVNPVDTFFVAFLPYDLAAGNRIQYDVVDRGAYEYFSNINDPGIVHEVIIPEFENVTSEPVRGTYWANAHRSFVVTFYPKEGYSLKYVEITTGSILQDELGGMKVVHNPDGSVTATFREVSEPLDIRLNNISPVSNNPLDGSYAVWTNNKTLHVKTTSPGMLKVYNLAGTTVKQQEIQTGETSVSLQQGIYIISFNDTERQKVVIK